MVTISILVITVIAVVIVTVAWARYITKNQGETAAQVAKWSFKLVDGKTETIDKIDFPITRTDSNNYVEDGLLAPRYIWTI